jgi:hypothetical protein
MSLIDYRPTRQDIALGSTSVSVRGLSINDCAQIIESHLGAVLAAFKAMEDSWTKDAGFDEGAMMRLIFCATNTAPELVADIISLAADEPEARSMVSTTPFTFQVSALVSIFKLTFEAGGGLGNFLATLREVRLGVESAMTPLQQDRLRAFLNPNETHGKSVSRETVS